MARNRISVAEGLELLAKELKCPVWCVAAALFGAGCRARKRERAP